MKTTLVRGSGGLALGRGLATMLGLPAVEARIGRFPDGECDVEVPSDALAGEVILLQGLGPPVNERLIELLLLSDALHRAGAMRITAVVPYFGYARHDHLTAPGQPLGTQVIARAMGSSRIERILTVDLHSPVLQSALQVPVENLEASALLVNALRPHVLSDAVVVAPDLGAAKLAERVARALELPMAIVHKRRVSGAQVVVHEVLGSPARKRPIIVDDMISTGATIAAAASALLERGCIPEVLVAATHGLFSGDAATTLGRLPIRQLVITNSLDVPTPAGLPCERVDLVPLLANALRRLHRVD